MRPISRISLRVGRVLRGGVYEAKKTKGNVHSEGDT